MAMNPTYSVGTVSVSAGSDVVTGSGTMWLAGRARAGDVLEVAGLSVTIASIDSNAQLTLVKPWPGSSTSSTAYEIRYTPDSARVMSSSRQLIETLEGGSLPALAALPATADTIPVFTGPGAATTVPLTSFARDLLAQTTGQGVRDALGLAGYAAAGIRVLGTRANTGALPTGAALGDAYLIGQTIHVWNGTAWQALPALTGPAGANGTNGVDGAPGRDGMQIYSDIATGRAAVSNGSQFQVQAGEEFIVYRRDSSTTQTEVARYPSAAGLNSAVTSLANAMFPERTLINRMSQIPDAKRRERITTLILQLKADGILQKCNGIYVTAAHHPQAARLNWATDGAYDLIDPDNTQPAFAVDDGYIGDGVSDYLTTGFSPTSSVGSKLGLNNHHLMVWTGSDIGEVRYDAGNRNLRIASWVGSSGATRFARTADTNFATDQPGFVEASGFTCISRDNSAGYEVTRNKQHVSVTRAVGAFSTSHLLMMADADTSNVPEAFSRRKIKAMSFGAALTQGERERLKDALQAYFDGIAADYVPPFEVLPVALTDFGFSTFTGADQHRGAGVTPDGTTIFMRRNLSLFTVIPPAGGGAPYQSNLGLPGAINTSGLTLGANGNLYSLPRDSNFVIEINGVTKVARMLTAADLGLPAGSLDGGNKWTGGVLGDDGFIYGAPSIATSVLKLDTRTAAVTATLETFGLTWAPASSNVADLQWVDGAKLPDGRIVFCPYSATSFFFLDPATQTASLETFGLTFGGSGARMWSDVTIGNDGHIYAAPRYANDIMRINPVNMTATRLTYGLDLSGDDKFSRAFTLSDGNVYFTPSSSPYMLAINPALQKARKVHIPALLSEGAVSYTIGGAIMPDGRLVLPPRGMSKAMIVG